MSKYITKNCVLCNSSFEVVDFPSTRKKMYCSQVCSNRAISKGNIKVKICLYCGEAYYGGGTQRKYCSSDCFRASRSIFGEQYKESELIVALICNEYPTANLEELAKKTNVSVINICNIANKRGIVRDIESRNKQYDTVNEYMTKNNPMKHPEIAAKVETWWAERPELRKVVGIKATQANQRNKPSKLEMRCAEYLTQLGLDYKHQAIIKDKFVVDFRMGNIILQCDGDYWHGHKRFEPLTERQFKQQKRDAAQDNYLQACGYTVIRIWESDMSLDSLRELLL